MCCLCYDIWKRFDILVISDKDDKPKAPSPASSLLYWFARDVKEPAHFSQKVGGVAPGFVDWPYLTPCSPQSILVSRLLF